MCMPCSKIREHSSRYEKYAREVKLYNEEMRRTAVDSNFCQDNEQESWIIQQSISEEGRAVANETCYPASLHRHAESVDISSTQQHI